MKRLIALAFFWLFAGDANAKTLGETAVAEQNKATALAYWRALDGQGWDAASQYLSPEYREHSGSSPSGVDELRSYYNNLTTAQPRHYSVVVRAFADADLVFLHVHAISAPGDFGKAYMCFLRFKDGKIVEQWTAKQPVPGIRNFNGMF